MSASRWPAVSLGHPRPVTTPTALSLLTAGGLLVLALFVPDQAFDQVSAAAEVQRVAVSPGRAQQAVSLRDRLVVGLQARLKSEVDFVELVALRVRNGQLPQRLVDETFFWARQRASSSRGSRARRPIIFFQPAMRARAERLHVEL
ncbi:MAG: hypothetical protein WD738_13115 [Pirellulales bacterium]